MCEASTGAAPSCRIYNMISTKARLVSFIGGLYSNTISPADSTNIRTTLKAYTVAVTHKCMCLWFEGGGGGGGVSKLCGWWLVFNFAVISMLLVLWNLGFDVHNKMCA